MKISTLKLECYRAFPAPVEIDIGGKNLLIYGENGSGKSSIYQALCGFFSPEKPSTELNTNLFQRDIDPNCQAKITVSFDDGAEPAVWTGADHPVGKDLRVTAASRVFSAFDYRSLLMTSNPLLGSSPNWFNLLVKDLVRNYSPALHHGAVVGECWDRLSREVDSVQSPNSPGRGYLTTKQKRKIRSLCDEFNEIFNLALFDLESLTRSFLAYLSRQTLSVNFATWEGLHYEEPYNSRQLVMPPVEPVIAFGGIPKIPIPQTFFNEARQTQISLALHLAAISLRTVPSRDTLKFLVLDDILIGMDQSNRLPVLNVLQDCFRGWQIILMTHDHTWYEMARDALDESKCGWRFVEMFDGGAPRQPNGTGSAFMPARIGPPGPPIVHCFSEKGSDAAACLLEQAKSLLEGAFYPAAANYTRTAYEAVLKRFCAKRKVNIPFNIEPGKVGMQELEQGLKKWLAASPVSDGKRNAVERALKDAEKYKKGILNPLSHSFRGSTHRSEICEAIEAVEGLQSALAALRNSA